VRSVRWVEVVLDDRDQGAHPVGFRFRPGTAVQGTSPSAHNRRTGPPRRPADRSRTRTRTPRTATNGIINQLPKPHISPILYGRSFGS
jgi:hypothetical protein